MRNDSERRYYCDDCAQPVQDPAPKPPSPPFRYVDPTRRPGADMCRPCFRAFNQTLLEDR